MCSLKKLLLLFLTVIEFVFGEKDEFFQTNIGDQMTIGISDTGYKSVTLKCGSDSMLVELHAEEDFNGIIYTKGNFHAKKPPCFLDPDAATRPNFFSIKFSFDQCNTQNNNEIYSNTLILQHDKELIMPGDAAFYLECDFTKPRDITVNANLQKKSVVSRIKLSDPDPAFKETKTRDKRFFMEGEGDEVILTQEFLKQRKDEL